jgi:hypothetical protein
LQDNLLLLSSICGFIAFPLAFSLGMRLTSAVHGAMLILALLPLSSGAIAFAWERRWPSWQFHILGRRADGHPNDTGAGIDFSRR